MKIFACFVFLSVFLAPGLLAQTQANSKLPQPYQFQIAAGVAEKLLIHKVAPVLSQAAMEAHGTTVLVVVIGKNGDVLHAKVISGPALHHKPALDAVRQYKYKPYLLNGEAVEAETTVAVTLNY
jgi:protein TonB